MESKERRERAQKVLENHEFTKMVDQNGYQVWRCKEPGTICYAFDIYLGRYGITITGDIGELTFDVARDLEFLAGKDIDYYIHSKLTQEYREQKILSKKKVQQMIYQTLHSCLYDSIPEGFKFDNDSLNLKPLLEIAQTQTDRKEVEELLDAYEELRLCDFEPDLGANKVYEIMFECSFVDCEIPTITEYSPLVMNRLYIVNEAARRILEMEESKNKEE